MDILLLCKALIMGIVEGIAEFFPISSTGHLILAGDLINFDDGKGKVFEVVIQLGAILAVCWEYRARIAALACGVRRDPVALRFVVGLGLAFLPAAVIGVLTIKTIKFYLFNAVSVAVALVVGGLAGGVSSKGLVGRLAARSGARLPGAPGSSVAGPGGGAGLAGCAGSDTISEASSLAGLASRGANGVLARFR